MRRIYCLLLSWLVCIPTLSAVGQGSSQLTSGLDKSQAQIGERFSRFEKLLLRLADVESVENPERAALLRRASRLSRETFILERIERAGEAIRQGRFAEAIQDQKSAGEGLSALLQLLQTEDRQARIRQEKERYRQLINDLKRLERSQRSTRSQTERGGELKGVLTQQEQINEKANDLKARLDEENLQKRDQGPSEQNTAKDSASEDPSEKPSEEKKENQIADSNKDPSQKMEKGENSQQAAQSPQQRAAKQVQQAQEQMRMALEKLRQQATREATESQLSAEEALRAAAEQLERILKQLREEEIQRQLVKLEGRLRELVTRQTQVLEKTRAMAIVPMEQRDRQLDIQASNLSFEEKKIALDADRALLLLAEDGTGHAFPEVLEQVRDDMYRVATRLSQSQVDVVTQGLQEDILSTLEEMIKALQQEQRKREQNEQGNPPSGQPSGDSQQEEPLVDKIAELKLIKTQEIRIKNATERYADVANRSASDADLLQLLGELSQRQIRLYRVVKEIVLEQNR